MDSMEKCVGQSGLKSGIQGIGFSTAIMQLLTALCFFCEFLPKLLLFHIVPCDFSIFPGIEVYV
jgi:hypothetical protein